MENDPGQWTANPDPTTLRRHLPAMRTTILILFTILGTGLSAQSNTIVAGLEATGNAGRLSVSIGQVAPLYMAAGGASLNQGVQQPYPELIGTGTMLHEHGGITVFPNPAHDHVRVRGTDEGPVHYRLLATDGRLLRTGPLAPMDGTIGLHGLPSGTYLLHLTRDDRPAGTYRILKTH